MSQSIIDLPKPEVDELSTISHDTAICELLCPNCGDGMKFDQFRCETGGDRNPRYRSIPAAALGCQRCGKSVQAGGGLYPCRMSERRG